VKAAAERRAGAQHPDGLMSQVGVSSEEPETAALVAA
jgi:hypothetical protein